MVNSEEPYTGNFIDKYGLDNYSDMKKLIICCYFVMTTLTTVGYGDFTPQTNLEKVVGIVIMILGIAFFSYIMGNNQAEECNHS